MTQTPVVPDAYNTVLQAKLKRDRQSFGEFRKVDQQLHDASRKQQIDATISELQESVRDYRLDITALEAEVAKQRSVVSLAGQHATAAEKYALEQRQAWELIRNDRLEDGTSPDEVVEAEIRMEKAERVAAARRTGAEPARIALEDAEAALAEERAELAEAEEQLARWAKAAGLPTRAPLSDVTIRTFLALIQSDEQILKSLSPAESERVSLARMGMLR